MQMATPTTNWVGFTEFDGSATGLGRYTSGGVKWGGLLGTSVSLTYSFPGITAAYDPDYAGQTGSTEWDGILAMTEGEKALARKGLAAWSAVARITFTEVIDTDTNVGEIRIAKSSSISADEYAHAYFPNSDASAGDVWLQSSNFNPTGDSNPQPGSNDFHTLIHEIGHALGLKHSFETPDAIPASLDNYFYSVMSYTARSAGDSGLATYFPTTPMYYDLLGIQAMYGRNMSHNSGDTTFTYREGQKYFETIDDAGGTDTIAYVGKKSSTINLNQGAFSALSEAISFDNGSTRATVAIGPNSIVENATGGSGNDSLTGNASANRLMGNFGSDTLKGNAGNDQLFGGLGNDSLSGGAGSDRFFFNSALSSTANKDAITDFSSVDDAIYVSRAIFTKIANAGTLASAYFWTGSAAHDANDYFVYNKAAGILSYDSNGSAAGGSFIIATVAANTTMTSADIIAY